MSGLKNALIHEYGAANFAKENVAQDDDPETQAALASEPDKVPVADRAVATVHKSFQGDMSLLAGPGKGIQSVPEYRRK